MADNESAGKVRIELEADDNSLEAQISDSLKRLGNRIATDINTSASNAAKTSGNSINGVFRKLRQQTINESNAAEKTLTRSMLGSAANIKAAFDMALGSIRAVISKAKEMTNAYQSQIEAETKLAATMRNSTGAAKEQIEAVKELASEMQRKGVIGDEVQLAGAQELATYVSSTESIKKMLPVLNDMVAQQYGYNASAESAVTISTMLGKVLQGQTSALHRYGYSFTKAQEQVLKYGNEQERVATLAAVVNESVSGVNNALANTPTGKFKQLGNDVGDMKEQLGQLITNVIAPLASWLDGIVIKLNSALSYLNDIVKRILKIKDALGDNVTLGGLSSSADEGTESLEGTASAAEKLKKALAGFDHLNILSDNSNSDDSSGSTESAGNTDISEADKTADSIDKKLDSIKSKLNDIIKNSGVGKAVDIIRKDIGKINFDAIKNNFSVIMDSLIPIAEASIGGVKKVIDAKIKQIAVTIGGITRTVFNVLQTVSGGIAAWISNDKNLIADYIRSITDHISSGYDKLSVFTAKLFEILNESIDDMRQQTEAAISSMLHGFTVFSGELWSVLSEGFDIAADVITEWINDNSSEIKEFFDSIQKIFADIMNGIGTVFTDVGNLMRENWENGGKKMWEDICRIVTDLGTIFLQIFQKVVMPLWNSFSAVVKSGWDRYIKPSFDSMSKAVISIWHNILSPLWNEFLKPLLSWFVDQFAAGFTRHLKIIENVFGDVFGAVGGYISNIWNAFSAFGEFLNGVFTGDFRKAMNGLSDTFTYSLSAMLSVAKGIINVLIDGLNALWTGIYNVGSGVVNTLGGISGAIGNVFGQNWSFNMPQSIPLIPRLATGGLVKAPTLAVVGDNKGAASDPEVVAPLSQLRGYMTDGSSEILMLLKNLLKTVEGKEETFVNNIFLDSDKIESKTVKVRKRNQRRYGGVV